MVCTSHGVTIWLKSVYHKFWVMFVKCTNDNINCLGCFLVTFPFEQLCPEAI